MKSDMMDQLFAASPDLICLTDRAGRLHSVSRSWGRALGWDESALVNRCLLDLIHPDERSSSSAALRGLRDKPLSGLGIRILDGDGAYRRTEWTIVPADPESLLAIGRELPSPGEVEEDGLDAEIRLARSIDLIPVAFALYDEEDRLIISNRQYEKTFATPLEPMIPGARFAALARAFADHRGIGAGPEEAARWLGARLDRRNVPARGFEYRFGGSEWAEESDFPLPDRQIITIAVDISERKRDEARLRDRERRLMTLQAELLQASRLGAVAHLSSALSHEIAQPLTAIGNYVQAARRRLRSRPEPEAGGLLNLLDGAAGQSRRAAAIIDAMKDIADRGEPARSPEDLNADVQAAAELAMETGAPGDLRLGLDLAAGLPAVAVNRIQIQQVVVNLVRNAAEATAGRARREVRVSTFQAASNSLAVKVCDNGGGLTEAVREGLFRPFTTTKPSGMGLGLSICRSIVEAHGGRIWADANADGGTCFCFTLPLHGPLDGPLDGAPDGDGGHENGE